jgi:hypothetical protein
MKTTLLRTLAIVLVAATAALPASAQIATLLDFDSVPSGTLASTFDTPNFSFHQAYSIKFLDVDGDPIAGTDHWAIDADSDAAFPVTVENPLDYGYGAAPSGSNALQALWQPVVIKFDQTYNLTSFTATLDNSSYGNLWTIDFINDTGTVSSLTVDQSVSGWVANAIDIAGITGIVLPSGAFYDNIGINAVAVPEPATYGLVAACATLGYVIVLRRRKKSV